MTIEEAHDVLLGTVLHSDADKREALRAVKEHARVEEREACAMLRCGSCKQRHPVRLADDGVWEHYDSGKAWICGAQLIRARGKARGR